jgi:hypothetical protein
MPLQKQAVPLNFAQGLDTKTDPKQVPLGKFLNLENSVFGTDGMLKKRNGYQELATITDASYLTTLNDNLTAISTTISAYSTSSESFVSKGYIQPMEVSTLPLIRNSINQIQCDAAVAGNGLVCTVYTETNAGITSYKYAVADSVTGQNVVSPTSIPVTTGVVTGSPRVFLLGNYFVIVFTNVIAAVSHLQYISVSTMNPTVVTANTDIVSSYVSATTLSWDGVVVNSALYLAYNTTTGGQSIKMTYLSQQQAATASAPAVAITFAGEIATIMNLCADITNPASPVIYLSYYDLAGQTGKSAAVDQNLNIKMTPTSVITSGVIFNVASAAQNGVCRMFYEVANNYSYDSAIPTHYVAYRNITLPNSVTTGTVSPAAGSAATGTVSLRSVGLASKAFIIDSVIYYLSVYQSLYQPTYFLVNGSISAAATPRVVGKLAYQNGGGYLTLGLPNVSVDGTLAQMPYLFKDLIAAANKGTALAAGTQVAGIYSQTGVNLSKFTISTQYIDSAEIASNLHISGGFLWSYDGYLPVEHNFFVYPDNIEATWSATGGSIAAKPDGSTNTNAYFYQVTYEWADNQGNIYRSAPSIPVSVTTTGAGTAGSITVNIPMLRLTYKTANPVKIVVYRWSVAQQIYYQVTSLTSATLNDTTIDSIAYVDTLADATILGNSILYTTGGVIEDINAPASNLMALFDTRLWLVDAEDPNLLWYSKQVIEATPVEMSDLLTIYVAPTTGVQGSTGPTTALSAMDDKLIIFKKDAIYYINGSGPDNTGANSQYSQPVFITSTVGCANQKSIVLMQNGVMFQSDKGIWILGRDLNTQYIGAPVEEFNGSIVTSAVNVPETTQIRFTLNTGQTLMYDYYYQQWGTFTNVPAISSCIYQSLHTYLNSLGSVFQETRGVYLDNTSPVLMNFTTSWLNIAGLQGYERFYFFYLLGTYYTPFKLNVRLAYDYSPDATQNIIVTPDNYASSWGDEASWGSGGPWGGPGNIFEARIFPNTQKCQSFQISINEIFDQSIGAAAGQGLSLSGINMIIGQKKGYRVQRASKSFGS